MNSDNDSLSHCACLSTKDNIYNWKHIADFESKILSEKLDGPTGTLGNALFH